MLDECLTYLEDQVSTNSNFSYEVLIVSDGSRDNTVKIGLKYVEQYGSDKVRVLELEKNRGKGGAVTLVKTIFIYAFYYYYIYYYILNLSNIFYL